MNSSYEYDEFHRLEGDKFFNEKKYEYALKIYEQLAQVQPQAGNIGQVKSLIAFEKIEHAFQLFNQIKQYNPSLIEFKEIADQFFKENQFLESSTVCDMLIQLHPQTGFLRKLKALIALRQFKNALSLSQQVKQYDPCSYDCQKLGIYPASLKGEIYLNENKYEEASIIYDMLMQLDPRKGWLGKLMTLMALGQMEVAIQMSNFALQQNPSKYECQQIGDQFFNQNKYLESSIMFDILVQLDQKNGCMGKVKSLIALGQIEDALKNFKEVQQNVLSYEEFLKIGEHFFRQKKYKEAQIVYDLLIQFDPQTGYLEKVKTLVALGKIQESLQMFDQAIQYDPSPYSCELIGEQFLEEKKYKEALIMYDMQIKLDPTTGYLAKGYLLVISGQIDQFLQMVNEAKQYDPSAVQFDKIGVQFFKEKKYQEALAVYEILIQLEPRIGYLGKGKTLISLGRMDEAFESLKKALQYFPSSYQYEHMGEELFKEKKYQDALIIYDMLLQLNLKNGQLGKVKTLIAQEKIEEAYQIFNEAIQQNPNSYQYIEISDQFYDQQKYQEALIIYDMAIQLENKMGYLIKVQYYFLGNKIYNERQYEKALVIFDKLIQYDPQNGYFRKIQVLIAQSKLEQASLIFNEAKKYEPSYLKYKQLADQLFQEKKYQEASITYDMLILLDKKSGYQGKVKTLIALGQIDDGLSMFLKGIKNNLFDCQIFGNEFFDEKTYELRSKFYQCFIGYQNKNLESQIPYILQIQYPWKKNKAFILQELGIYDLKERYSLGSQLVLYK